MTCSDQCSLKAFGLDHANGRLFVTSQWSSRPLGVLLYAIYQTLILIFVFTVMIYAPLANQMGAKFLIFLTYWGFLCLTGCFVMRCFTTWLCYFRGFEKASSDTGSIPWFLKLQWVLYNLATSMGAIVSLVFWLASFNGDLSFANFSTHGMNIIIIAVDIFITAHPVRILHLYQPMILASMYSVFVGIYWAAKGTNDRGEKYIYKYTDFDNNMALACGLLAALALAILPVSHCVIFSLYQLRLLISRTCCGCCNNGKSSPTHAHEMTEIAV